jgi:hypothetical protein
MTAMIVMFLSLVFAFFTGFFFHAAISDIEMEDAG